MASRGCLRASSAGNRRFGEDPEAGRRVAGRFADGVWLAELAPARIRSRLLGGGGGAWSTGPAGVPAAQALARVLARQQLEQLRKTPRGNDTASFLATMEPLPPRT